MRIIEILSAASGQEINPEEYPRSLPIRIGDQQMMQHIANAFTRDGAVKGLWNVDPFDQAPDPEPSARSATTMPDAASSAVPPPSFVPGTFDPRVTPADRQSRSFDPRRMPVRR